MNELIEMQEDSFNRLIIATNARQRYPLYKKQVLDVVKKMNTLDIENIFDAIIAHNYEVCIDIATQDLTSGNYGSATIDILLNETTFDDAVDEYTNELYADLVMNENNEEKFFWVMKVLTEEKICVQSNIDAAEIISFNDAQNSLLDELTNPVASIVWELGYLGYLEDSHAIIVAAHDLEERMMKLE